jgi:autotransporter-associated beta strand protein/predicted outer membrane repeat protein
VSLPESGVIAPLRRITFSENKSGVNGGAIYANGTEASVMLSSHEAILFQGNKAGLRGGAIFAQSNDATGDGTYVEITGGSISFLDNTSDAHAGGIIGADGKGGAIFARSTANIENDLVTSTVVKLESTNGAIVFTGNKASSGSAIYIENNQPATHYADNKAVYASLYSQEGIQISSNQTGTDPHSHGAVDIQGAGGGKRLLEMTAQKGIYITNNINRAIYVESKTSPSIGGTIELTSMDGPIRLSNNTLENPSNADASAGGAGILAISQAIYPEPFQGYAQYSDPQKHVNSHIIISTGGNTANIFINSNTATGQTYTDAFNPGRGGGAAIAAVTGQFMDSATATGLDPRCLPNSIRTPGNSQISIVSQGGLDVSQNILTMGKGAGYDAIRSTQYIGGGALYGFNTGQDGSIHLEAVNGALSIRDNKAVGSANPNGGAIFGAGVGNYVYDELSDDNYVLQHVPIQFNVQINSAHGDMTIDNNNANGKGGAIFLKSDHGNVSLDIKIRDGNGFITNNSAATGSGASLETGGAFHLEAGEATTNLEGLQFKGGKANFYIDTNGMGKGNTLTISGNTVGTGADLKHTAIYLKSGNTDPGTNAGNISIIGGEGSILLYDGILAEKNPSSGGYYVDIHAGLVSRSLILSTPLFAQIGPNAIVQIPGLTYVDGGGMHKLSQGARYDTTFTNGATHGGTYLLDSSAWLAAEGVGNVIAAAEFKLHMDSHSVFILGTPADPWHVSAGNSTPMLTFESPSDQATAFPQERPGGIKLHLTGAATPGAYWLVDASFDTNTVVTTTFSGMSPLDVTNLTLNNNPVSLGSASGVGRDYAFGYLTDTYNDSEHNKLHLVLGFISGNTESTWTGTAANKTWKSEVSTDNYASWSGTVATDAGPVASTTFLNGDIVVFNESLVANPSADRAVTVAEEGVITGAMYVTGGSNWSATGRIAYTFSGGKITGSSTDSTYHSSVTSTYTPQTTGQLYVNNGATATFANPVKFNGVSVTGNAQVNFQRDTDIRGDLFITDQSAATISSTFNATGVITIGEGEGSPTPFTGSSLVIADGGTLGTSHNNDVILSNSSSYVKFDRSAGNDYTYKGTIQGTGGLMKSGEGTLTLAANQDYSGQFAITGGTVVLQHITQLAVGGSLNKGTMLAGDGTATASGDFFAEAVLSPGIGKGAQKIGTLTFNATGAGTLTLSANAKLIIDISGAANDKVLVTNGNIVIQDGASLDTALELASVGGKIFKGDTHVILATTNGSISGADKLLGEIAFVGDGTDADPDYKFRVEEFTSTQGGVTTRGLRLITTYAIPFVPEPSTYALCGALASLGLALLRNRKRRQNSQHNPRQGRQSQNR